MRNSRPSNCVFREEISKDAVTNDLMQVERRSWDNPCMRTEGVSRNFSNHHAVIGAPNIPQDLKRISDRYIHLKYRFIDASVQLGKRDERSPNRRVPHPVQIRRRHR